MQTVEGGKKRFQKKKKRIEGSQRHHTAELGWMDRCCCSQGEAPHSLSRVAVAFFLHFGIRGIVAEIFNMRQVCA